MIWVDMFLRPRASFTSDPGTTWIFAIAKNEELDALRAAATYHLCASL